ncbi:hypothetical protein BNJ_00242 [Kaumoebavirus]|uniref:hypothetical protein n=1 Tax=Kaumoebavirus TaxID=1859492 RepID=UPI0009C21C55|nr:hypothetical protein BNJ_00242 [Kaumoebavirus]ARA72070.1 hypothetical protein BNJ_00242 [Kaumoebavirus]
MGVLPENYFTRVKFDLFFTRNQLATMDSQTFQYFRNFFPDEIIVCIEDYLITTYKKENASIWYKAIKEEVKYEDKYANMSVVSVGDIAFIYEKCPCCQTYNSATCVHAIAISNTVFLCTRTRIILEAENYYNKGTICYNGEFAKCYIKPENFELSMNMVANLYGGDVDKYREILEEAKSGKRHLYKF